MSEPLTPELDALSREFDAFRDNTMTEFATMKHELEDKLADPEEPGTEVWARIQQALDEQAADGAATEQTAPDESVHDDEYYDSFSIKDSPAE